MWPGETQNSRLHQAILMRNTRCDFIQIDLTVGVFLCSILVSSLDWSRISPNLPWLVDAGGCVLLDSFVSLSDVLFTRSMHIDLKGLIKVHNGISTTGTVDINSSSPAAHSSYSFLVHHSPPYDNLSSGSSYEAFLIHLKVFSVPYVEKNIHNNSSDLDPVSLFPVPRRQVC